MNKQRGFLEYPRAQSQRRPAEGRIKDFREFETPPSLPILREQAARCMDCGIPFCNTGCPLANLIPDFNNSVFENDLEGAAETLAETNNFPEFTGRICPAPCEAACVLGISEPAVNIKLIERAIADHECAGSELEPHLAKRRSGKTVAIVGSGPAGLAAAQQLVRKGHRVTVFERDELPGGLLTLGIPDFKLEKSLVARRVRQLEAEGVAFKLGTEVGRDVAPSQLTQDFDAVCLAIGARVARDLAIPGRKLAGVHLAMEYLVEQNRALRQGCEVRLSAQGKHVVVIGGGDTGSDCVGTALRQGAESVTSLEIQTKPPLARSPKTPWPQWPLLLRTSSSHEEGGTRRWKVSTTRFVGTDGAVSELELAQVRTGTGFEVLPETAERLRADLVLLALGFSGAERLLAQALELRISQRGQIEVDERMMTSKPGVFAAGDCFRGQSLVVWAIADGRRVADAIDDYLR